MPSVTIPFRDSPSRARKVVRRGDVLMSTVRPNLRAFAYFDQPFEDCVASTGFAVLRVKQSADPRFVLYSILSDSVTRQIEAHVVGSNYPAINSTAVSQLKVLTPTPTEQSKIAEILSIVDRAIEQTEALIAKQQRIKTGLMQDLLTRGIDEQGNLRSEETHQFKDSPLGRIPVEWDVGNILAFTSRTRQPILTGPFGSSLGTDDFVEDGVPVLRVGIVQAGYIDMSKLDFVTPAKAEELSRYRIKEGDLLFARSGATTGRNALADSRCEDALINYHIIRVATDPERCDPTYLYTLFNSRLVQKQVDQEKGKSTREGVNTATILSFSLVIPPVDEQRHIGKLIRATDTRIETMKDALSKSRALKTALMQDLLTGEKRVTPLLEPAVTT